MPRPADTLEVFLLHIKEKISGKCQLVSLHPGLQPSIFDPTEEIMTKGKRTTHRSSKGTKLYAVRDSNGRFKDIQTYKRAHSADMRRKSKSET